MFRTLHPILLPKYKNQDFVTPLIHLTGYFIQTHTKYKLLLLCFYCE